MRPPRTPKSPPEGARSPRIEALRADLDAERFWTDVARRGTPLVEPIDGDPGHRAVTFLWRDRHGAGPGTRTVVLMANKLTDPSVWAHSVLERVEGTDVWQRSYRLRADWRASYQLAPDDGPAAGGDAGAVVGGREVSPGARGRWRGLAGLAGPDPLNPNVLAGRDGSAESSIVELPDAPPQPWLQRRPGVPAGAVEEHRLRSGRLGNERRVWVQTPRASGPFGLIVLLDGEDWVLRLRAADTVDNLTAAGRIAPSVVLMVDALDPATRRRELGCHEPFVEFLAHELVPWARARWTLTDAPATIAGHSLGGLTAAFAALREPGVFGRVLAQSASLWWPGDPEPDLPGDWLMRRFAIASLPPLRFDLRVGLQEWVLAPLHRHLRDVLVAKGHAVTYTEYFGGHDVACWRGGLGDGLIALA